MFTVSCVYGFARGRTAFIFFNTAIRRIPLLVLLTAMNWIKRASTSITPTPPHSPALPCSCPQLHPTAEGASSSKHNPQYLNQWQTPNKLKMGGLIKPTGWSWTGNLPTAGTTPSWAGNEAQSYGLHCIAAGITGFLLQNYFISSSDCL